MSYRDVDTLGVWIYYQWQTFFLFYLKVGTFCAFNTAEIWNSIGNQHLILNQHLNIGFNCNFSSRHPFITRKNYPTTEVSGYWISTLECTTSITNPPISRSNHSSSRNAKWDKDIFFGPRFYDGPFNIPDMIVLHLVPYDYKYESSTKNDLCNSYEMVFWTKWILQMLPSPSQLSCKGYIHKKYRVTTILPQNPKKGDRTDYLKYRNIEMINM